MKGATIVSTLVPFLHTPGSQGKPAHETRPPPITSTVKKLSFFFSDSAQGGLPTEQGEQGAQGLEEAGGKEKKEKNENEWVVETVVKHADDEHLDWFSSSRELTYADVC
jgi:hypothetical protein